MNLGNILFLGTGNMGGGILRGLLDQGVVKANAIGILEPNDSLAETFTAKGCKRISNVEDGFAWADVAIICVKPQVFLQVKEHWRTALMSSGRRPEFISVMAGISRQDIQDALSNSLCISVIRTMPNLPMTVGKGTVALAKDDVPAELVAKAEQIFAPVATTLQVQESWMDAVTALSGSGPAYVFQFIEGLAQAGVKVGLPRDTAMSLTLSTLEGALAMVRQTGKSPADLTTSVCSPGGTTIYGLHALEEGQFRATLMKAVESAAKRSKELGTK